MSLLMLLQVRATLALYVLLCDDRTNVTGLSAIYITPSIPLEVSFEKTCPPHKHVSRTTTEGADGNGMRGRVQCMWSKAARKLRMHGT
jgi:hypothetical protein